MFEIYELETVNIPNGKTIAQIVGRGIGGGAGTGRTFLGVFENEADARDAYDNWSDKLEGTTARRPWDGIDRKESYTIDHTETGIAVRMLEKMTPAEYAAWERRQAEIEDMHYLADHFDDDDGGNWM